jgi:hypothetical protein
MYSGCASQVAGVAVPCKGVRGVADVLIGMWVPRTLIIKRSSRLDLHGRNDSGRIDGNKEDAGRVGCGRDMVEARWQCEVKLGVREMQHAREKTRLEENGQATSGHEEGVET